MRGHALWYLTVSLGLYRLCLTLLKLEAVCFDACALLDKVQILTPIGEMASSASKVMSSATEFVKVAPDMKPA